jgi:hypothetical protein
MSPVTGTSFIESTPIKNGRSLSASLHGGRHPVAGVTAAFATAPIDSTSAGELHIIDAGKTEYVPARYTAVYENRDGEWLIAHHHSSLMP